MKAIPKRDGQKLNGVMPSVFALGFLLVMVPFVSTYLVTAALYVGDEAVVSSYEKSDILLGEYPYYEASGNGPNSKCQSASILTIGGTDCSSNLTLWGPLPTMLAHQGQWKMAMPTCHNSNQAIGVSMGTTDCGDSDFRISENITDRFGVDDRIFPSILFNASSKVTQTYDPLHMGPSKLDYTIWVRNMVKHPLIYGTNLWSYWDVGEELKIEGSYSFNSSYYVNGSNTQVKNKINFAHDMDFLELDKLSQILDNHKADLNNSFGIYITFQIDNLRNEDGYLWSSVNYYNAFEIGQDGDVELSVDLAMYEANPVNTFLRFGVLFMGGGFWAIALASTPYWDPLIKKKGGEQS